jgi:hypothetical protein
MARRCQAERERYDLLKAEVKAAEAREGGDGSIDPPIATRFCTNAEKIEANPQRWRDSAYRPSPTASRN